MGVIVPENPVEKNNAINSMEIEARRKKLYSTPTYITIGAHFGCNANCLFSHSITHSITLCLVQTCQKQKRPGILTACTELNSDI